MSENNSCSLAERDCVPCKGGVPPLKGEMLQQYQTDLGGGWEVVNEQRLEKTYKFKNFRQALDFTIQVGELAENVKHHPDIFLAWGQVKLTIWTHKIGGLSESDFILAAKADRLLGNREGA
jgi:4a-hydroxytetrahydrobiopterin dehydratase